MTPVRIGILGDYRPDNTTHTATDAAFRHAADALGTGIEATWLATDEPYVHADFHGFLCAPGSPYKNLANVLAGIRYAREHQVPFLGTCGGFQHLILEYARNIMHLVDAAHAESDPYASRLVVTPLSCSLVGRTMEVVLAPDSQAALAFGAERSLENFYCNFGLNPEYEAALEDAGLRISGRDQNGESRVVELASHPFFLGTLFVPQARSTPDWPHPLIVAMCRAATEFASLSTPLRSR